MNVVVLGAGYAGVTAGLRLESALPDDVELTIIDESEFHLVRHEVHRVIRRPGFAADLTVPLADLFDDADVRQARIETVDPDSNRIALAGEEITYDYAAVCLGSQTNFYDLPGVEDQATTIEDIEDATRIRDEFLTLDDDERVVVGGAGLTGIQVAGELAALAREKDMAVDILLVEQFADVAPGFPGNFQEAAREEIEKRDIEVRTGTTITAATDTHIEVVDGSLSYDQFIWAGGIRGPQALSGSRPTVRGSLRLGDGTFVVGDAADVIDRAGERVPASAQSAIREARTAARNITRLVEHDRERDGVFEPRLDSLAFHSRGWIVTIGDGAVAQVGPTVLRGAPALALKATAGVGYLTSVGAVREAVELAREEFSGAVGPQT